MSNKKMSVVLTVLIIGMIAIVFTVTYSYFDGKINNDGGKLNLNSGEIGLTITKPEIIVSDLIPEYDTNIESSSNVYNKTFTITRDSGSTGDICYNLELAIDSLGTTLALSGQYIKYQVTSGNQTTSGNLLSLEDKTLFQNQVLLSNETSKTYNVKVWLSYNDNTNQTQMLESTNAEDRQLKMHLELDGKNGNCN